MLYCKLHPANVAMLRVNGGLRLLLRLCCFLLSIAFGHGSTLASTCVVYYFKDKREDSCSKQIQTCSNMTLGNKVFNLTFSIFERENAENTCLKCHTQNHPDNVKQFCNKQKHVFRINLESLTTC